MLPIPVVIGIEAVEVVAVAAETYKDCEKSLRANKRLKCLFMTDNSPLRIDFCSHLSILSRGEMMEWRMREKITRDLLHTRRVYLVN